MRRILVPTVAVCAVLAFSAGAQAQTGGQITGFGGSTFGTTSAAPTFGGGVAIPLGDHAQVIGEFGRLTDVPSNLVYDVLELTQLEVELSAWYGEGGLRFTGSRYAVVRPYFEATAGVARLSPSVGLDGVAGAIASAGLSFLNETEPLVGVGGGVLVQTGPLVVDVGYRYKRILANGALSSVYSLGNDGFDINQVRLGVGVRF